MTKAQAAAFFQRLFTGYSKAYGTYDPRMLPEKGKKKPAHRAIRSPCTAECYLDHLSGRQPLGIYLLDDDQMLRFAAIDIDVYPIDHASISAQLNEWALPMVVCSSKSGGAHIYIFFSRPENPACVRVLLKDISVALGHPTAEIFPKQNSRSGNNLGNFINLPFFSHPALNYACWDGKKELDYEGFLELANSRQTTVEQLQFQLSKAGILKRSEGSPVVTPFNSGGRNEYLFNFGRKLFELIPDMESVVREIRKKNGDASTHDHPNFGSEGPLPEKELESIIASLKKIVQGKPDQSLSATIKGLNEKHAHLMIGGKARIMNISADPNTGWLTYDFSTAADLRSRYSNQKVVANGKRQTFADVWLSHPERRSYLGITFHPSKNVDGYFNLFQGFPVMPIKGNCSLYLQHIHDNICCADSDLYTYVVNWMADAIQNPSVRPGVALAIRGKQGVGKGVFVNNFSSLFGPHFIQVTQSAHLVGNFNAHLKDRLLVFADEAFWAGDKRAEGVLKGLITENQLLIELKGVDVQSIPNHVRLIMASNNSWLVPASADQRRFVVLEAGSSRIRDSRYFAAIAEEMNNGGREALMDFLVNRDLEGVDLRQIPRTQALAEQQLRSLGSVGQWLYSCLDFGGIEEPESGGETYLREWPEDYEIKKMFNAYAIFCKRSGLSHPERITTFGKALKELMPTLVKRREGSKTRRSIYLLPKLEQAREEFEQANQLNSIDWARDDNKLV